MVKINHCLDCQKEITPGKTKRCRSCAMKNRYKGKRHKFPNFCLDCGKETKGHGKRCYSCVAKKRCKDKGWQLHSKYSGFCIDCGKEITIHAERCHSCAKKEQWKNPTEKMVLHLKSLRNAKFTLPEILFSLILANENIPFIHQFRIKKWFVDFFIFPNIIIQIDGVYWHCKKGRQLSDWYQNRELKKHSFKVIRFWDFEINNNLEKCLKKIKNERKI